MTQAGAARDWQRWLDERYARVPLNDAWWESYWATGPGAAAIAESRADLAASKPQLGRVGTRDHLRDALADVVASPKTWRARSAERYQPDSEAAFIEALRRHGG